MIKLIDPRDHRTVPWKNGGGTATDYAVELAGDGEVVWRIGTAEILKDGPFSDYAGVTRVFTIIHGPGVHLDFEGEGTRTLPRDQPTRFAGAPAPFSRLRGAPATAFNLLMRDGAVQGDVAIWRGHGEPEAIAAAETIAVVAIEGTWSVTEGAETAALPPGWTALVAGGQRCTAAAPAGARAAIVRLRPA
ncbi:HutD/Ves family protein [Phreatobacter stygius]|uniref:HutD family protein n=1 Tax=Phreatobacter stygius TaxID=1940610 RepID=A0A4D7ARH1_9HYPH|nr:HutD family protein [Phreatobacter stygius]QCI63549.1 HutD family protein [Phreatobacter stygius]